MNEIAKALVALQADMETVDKSAVNPFFKSKYTPLPQVMEALQPLLKKNKLAILLPLTNIDGVSAIKTVIVHESGEVMEFEPFPLILSKQDPQGQGSAVTYARRYALQSVTGMVSDEDDDGNKASKPTNTIPMSDVPPPRLGNKATTKQLAEMFKIAKEQKGFTDQSLAYEWLEQEIGKDPREATTKEASDFIGGYYG